MSIAAWMGSKDYLDNTPSFPLEQQKMGCFSATDHMMIKMEIKISFRNSYLYLPESILLDNLLIFSSGNDGVMMVLEHVFNVLLVIQNKFRNRTRVRSKFPLPQD